MISVDGRSLWLIAPEELAVLKAFSDRERDFEDLVNLSAVLGSQLDVNYVKQWARRLDDSIGGDEVSDRLQKALARVVRPLSSNRTAQGQLGAGRCDKNPADESLRQKNLCVFIAGRMLRLGVSEALWLNS